MRKTDALTDLSRRNIVSLTLQITAAHEKRYASAPPAFVALQVREFVRFCEMNGIVEPDDLETVILSVFSPSPLSLRAKDREYILFLIGGTESGPDAKTLSVQKFCSSLKRRHE